MSQYFISLLCNTGYHAGTRTGHDIINNMSLSSVNVDVTNYFMYLTTVPIDCKTSEPIQLLFSAAKSSKPYDRGSILAKSEVGCGGGAKSIFIALQLLEQTLEYRAQL